jgi:hypothetical protein
MMTGDDTEGKPHSIVYGTLQRAIGPSLRRQSWKQNGAVNGGACCRCNAGTPARVISPHVNGAGLAGSWVWRRMTWIAGQARIRRSSVRRIPIPRLRMTP